MARLGVKSFKVDEPLWESFKAEAAEQGVTAGALLRSLLETYVEPDVPCASCGEASPLTDQDSGQYEVIGSTGLPVASQNPPWDGEAAKNRVWELCTNDEGVVDVQCVERAFLYRTPGEPKDIRESYKLGFADVIDGRLQIVPNGVYTAAGGHGVNSADIPDQEKNSIKRRICTIYSRIPDAPECPFTDEENEVDAMTELASTGVVIDDNGDPVLDDNGDPTPCSCDPEAEDYDENCDCDEDTDETDNPDSDADDDSNPFPPKSEKQTAAIMGVGRLHTETKDPDTLAAVNRVIELLEDGAVGVSVAMDMDPDTMPDPEELNTALAEGDFDQVEELMADVKQRLRHLAIVDTAAFSDCRMAYNAADGTISGPMTYEGIWTGDARFTPFGSVVWESTLPIPIIWDREDGDHTGMTIGSITTVERVEGEVSSPHTNPEAVAAAARATEASLLDNVPARYFATRQVTPDTPFTIAAPDGNGLRHVYGLAAPKGVCHRSGDGSQCFQYPGDVDPQKMRGFHTGTALTLDDNTTVRVGAITLGGMHIDTSLAARGVGITDLSRYREDANQVFALVRAYETPYGLAVAGVVVPGVTEKQLAQARACAPSVELWPSGRGRTLAGIHLVPSPAWPVAASVGSAMEMHSTAPVVVEAAPPTVNYTATEITFTATEADRLSKLEASLARIEKALALLASEAITDVPLPDPAKE